MSKTYDANFEEWYKRLFNKNFDRNTDSLRKTDTMSDEDFEVGTNLYNAYLQKNNLLDQYNKAQSSLEQEKIQSQQQASIQLDKLKKYIPTQIKAQGLGGLGVSESTLLKANSDYQNRMGQIASDVGARQMDLLKSYNSGVLDIDTKLKNANMTTLNKYQEIRRQAQNDAYNSALIDIGGSSLSNEQEMLEFIEGYRDSVSEEQFDNLVQTGKGQVDKNLNEIKEQRKGIIDGHYQEMLLNPEYLTEDGFKLTESGRDKLKEYLDKNKEILGDDLYNSYLLDLDSRPIYTKAQHDAEIAAAKQKEEEEANNQKLALSLGSNGAGISAESAKESDFGSYYDTGKAGTKQSEMVKEIIRMAKNGEIEDGTYIDFNYGNGGLFGLDKGSIWVYVGGKFYPTKHSRSTAQNFYLQGKWPLGGGQVEYHDVLKNKK